MSGCKGGSRGCADFIHQCCCEVPDVIVSVNWQTSFGTTECMLYRVSPASCDPRTYKRRGRTWVTAGWTSTELAFPQELTEGISFGCHPYLNARASLKTPLCNENPCSSIGSVPSQAEAPFLCQHGCFTHGAAK